MTNVMHKFFSMCLYLFITFYMFPARRVHHRERQIVSIQPLVTVMRMECELDFNPDMRTASSLAPSWKNTKDRYSFRRYPVRISASYRCVTRVI